MGEMTRREKGALDRWITSEPDFDDDDEPPCGDEEDNYDKPDDDTD